MVCSISCQELSVRTPYLYFLLISLSGCSQIHRISRSSFRNYKQKEPQITTSWNGDTEDTYTCISSSYAASPIFHLGDPAYNAQRTLPSEISLCTPADTPIPKKNIETAIMHLLDELYEHKHIFRDFIVLQRKNFNRRKLCGLLVLKFKNYPFVLKLFMETPKTFINPYCTGFEPISFFFMAGGSNRHISGLTRLYHAEYILHACAQLPQWQDKIHIPRKWFWQPDNVDYITITGTNIDDEQTSYTVNIPSIYAIIADYVDTHETCSLSSSKRKK